MSQSRLYADVLRAMGRDLQRVDLGDCGRAQLILRRVGPLGQVALMPGGPLWREGAKITARRAALRDLPRLMRAQGIAALITNCATPLEEKILCAEGHLPLLTGGFEARLDLTAPAGVRRARMQGKWRNRLARAEGAGLSVIRARFCPRKHGWLLRAEAAQRHARGYRGLPLEFAAVAAEQAPGKLQLFTVSHAGDRLAAMLFVIHGRAASYHIGQISDAGRRLAAHNLLLWRAADWLARQGVERLDLGPVETERNAGLARFKLGSGAAPVPRGASCLYTRLTAPLGRLVHAIRPPAGVRGFAARNGRSCR